MKLRYVKVKGFEANIVPDSNDENEFYTIRKEYKIPLNPEDLDGNLDHFVMNELVDELACLDHNLKPCAILIVYGYRLAFITTDEIALEEYEIPFAKITIDENGNPDVINLLEDL